ncbi:unnamed protein product [Didymodactylos carnosus]|uniref:Uncharacterized protein n=1 Tax=Didymodactylos carnosus TaxID=1234261 RepID=A0A8S2GBL9_9BILA|nr:unnamed protein product [Didymodactylos carnosus]CAF4505170.1 unnamed protein product [Didymodactylos carnosus]
MSHNSEFAQLDNVRQSEYRKRFSHVKQTILHIGDIVFIPHGSNDGVRVKNTNTVDKIAELLQLTAVEFSSALVTELQVTRGNANFSFVNV